MNRSGPHRLSTKMARRWASLGFDVLRVDLSGIGDSPAAPGTQENVTYPPRGMDDLSAAIATLQARFGAARVIIGGVCSGGDYAFQLGSRDARVATALIMNPRTFCRLDLRAVESSGTEPPSPTVESVPATLRAMVDAGVDTFLLVSVADPGIAYVDAHFGAEMASLTGAVGFTRLDLSGADHTFTPVSAQEKVLATVTQHLLTRFPGAAGA